MSKNKVQPSPAAQCSAPIVSREQLMEAEAALMKAAMEFGRGWGCDQTAYPKSYWLEIHIERWRELTLCALKYSECFEEPNVNGGRKLIRADAV